MNNIRAKIRNHCLRLLKYRPRSKLEIEERLERKKFPEDLIKEAIREFIDCGLIDDRAFAKFWLNWRSEVNPRSKNFIRLELRQKGIGEDLIKETLESISSENEFLKAKKLAEKRLPRLKNIEPKRRKQRLYMYLQRRGFSPDIIFDIINEVL